jgi:trans-aconitate 2-methyltransferase
VSDYRWDAADYEQHSAGQQKWGRELITRLHLRGYERILDIGCGDGKVTAELAARVPDGSVVGADSSPQMIELARSRHRDIINLRFDVADALRLPYAAEFDIVFSNAVLHWVEDHLRVLRGIHASLAGGGRILLSMGGRGNASDMVAVIDDIIARPEWASYFRDFAFPYRFYGVEEYEKWLVASGFRTERLELVPKSMAHEGRESLESWIRSTWLPYTQRIPEEQRPSFESAACQEFERRFPPDASGRLAVAMIRLEVEARKA